MSSKQIVPYDLFIKIPKTASTSLDVAMTQGYAQGSITDDDIHIFSAGHNWCYYPIKNRHFRIEQPKLDKWSATHGLPVRSKTKPHLSYKLNNVYAVLRNPFDILVSYYHHTEEINGKMVGWWQCNVTDKFQSWDEFLEAYINPEYSWHIHPFKKSLFTYAYDEDWNFIPNKYFKYENLEELNQYLISRKFPPLSHSNKTSKKQNHYRTYYKPHHVDALNKIWKKDLTTFGYEY